MEIASNRLHIDIIDPGTRYQGARFDWTGICRQVTLDRRHTFCSQEAGGGYTGSNGIGLCGEFGISTAVGYERCAIGEQFPKIGVGRLTRISDKPYFFMDNYPLDIFDIRIEASPSHASFIMENCHCGEYRFDYTKTLTVRRNVLSIDCTLTNRCSLPIVTEEYQHNFMAINAQTIGPEYVVQVPFPLQAQQPCEPCAVEGANLMFKSVPQGYFDFVQQRGLPLGPFAWRLLHMPTSVGVDVTEHFTPHLFEVWGMAHAIAPEVQIRLEIAPGSSFSWKREYAFFGPLPS